MRRRHRADYAEDSGHYMVRWHSRVTTFYKREKLITWLLKHPGFRVLFYANGVPSDITGEIEAEVQAMKGFLTRSASLQPRQCESTKKILDGGGYGTKAD